MERAYKSVYYVDGKVFKPKKKNGIENKWDHFRMSFIDFEILINETVSYLESKGVKDTNERNAYETLYKFFAMKERE